MPKTIYIVCGPTAVGKTTYSIELAKKLGTEIISADSRQLYREIPIGTAQPSAEELAQVKHHLIASKSVVEPYNAGQFERDALAILQTIFEKSDSAVICGGTGLYINSLVYGFDELPRSSGDLRNELTNGFKENGIVYLQDKLKVLDPEYYATADLNNQQRLIRALEVCLVSGKPYSSFRTGQKASRNFNIEWIGLDMDRNKLYQRINDRVDQMLASGFVNEVKSVAEHRNCNALQTLGYREMFNFLDGTISESEAVENMKTNTRRFAKRQLTWFRREKNMKWING